MKRFLKEKWGLGFFIAAQVIRLIFYTICLITGWRLRTAAAVALEILRVVDVAVLFIWGYVDAWKKRDSSKLSIKKTFALLSVFAGVVLLGFSFLIPLDISRVNIPETVTEKYGGIKMVMRGSRSVGHIYEYYEYKGAFFYGKKLGEEYYLEGETEPYIWSFSDSDGNTLDEYNRFRD